ncbi:MAG: dienelactone hydrolase family protein [Gammaproteobacteria bacterium]|nr:dienelactone hydrolase family protein [Gammaproteobacteria bacterium]
MVERKIEYRHEDTVLEGLLCHDGKSAQPRPAILIAHAWAGRSEFENEKARKLAELGYVGFAIDLYGKGVLGTNPEENTALMMPFLNHRARLQARLHTALAALRAQPEVAGDRVAAIGYCFGGLCVLDLARTGADVKGVASFHGLLGKPGNTDGIGVKASVLVLHGHDDPMVPVADVVALETELTESGADWQIHTYGNTMHSFTNPEANDPGFGVKYEAKADRRSWTTLLDFLGEVLN